MSKTKAKHLLTGEQGEQIAADYLIDKGYRIVARNFRHSRGEIDLIAWWGDKLLVFVEVKTRHHELFGGPEEAVTVKKQRLLARTAGAYMEAIGYDWAIRFDVVAVLLEHDKVKEIRHHEDAFIWM
jgi:putative endonuclease